MNSPCSLSMRLVARLTLIGVWLTLAGCDTVPPATPAVVRPAQAGPSATRRLALLPSVLQPADAPEVAQPAEDSTLELSLESALLLALENNRALAVERLGPAVARTAEQTARAVFDPVLNLRLTRDHSEVFRQTQTGTGNESVDSDATSGSAALSVLAPTGTTVEIEASGSRSDSSRSSDPFAQARVGLTVNQALLAGRPVAANLASLRQAQIDTRASEYEFRAFAEALVAQVEKAYWDYAFARRQMEIFKASLDLARQNLWEIEERIRVGKLAETELAAARAELALRHEDLINARSTLHTARLHLLRLLNPPGDALWERRIELLSAPALPEATADSAEEHIAVAMRMRPDLNQARLSYLRSDLEIVKTRNGLLPRMDAFITLGRTGYSDSFGAAVRQDPGDGEDWSTGLAFQYALLNRAERARYQRAETSRDQALGALSNLRQLVEYDVRTALIEVKRAREQITATAATRALQEETLRAETEKLRVGKSTAFQVAQAQRDLLASQIAEVRAVVTYRTALVDLHRLDGSLLLRHGLSAPGEAPVVMEPRFSP